MNGSRRVPHRRPGRPVVLRPVTHHDLDAVVALLHENRDELVGMTSLSADPGLVAARIDDSVRTVTALGAGHDVLEDGEAHHVLFVLDDGTAPLGLTGVAIDGGTPSAQLGVTLDRDGDALVVRCDVTRHARTELESTFLAPRARGRGHGALLSRGRLLWLRLVAGQVPGTVVSYLRGRVDGDRVPFWEALSARLHGRCVEPPDDPTVLAGVSVPLDPELAALLGRLHPATRPAFELLVAEGLRPDGRFDPVDGGPTLSGELRHLATPRATATARLASRTRLGGDTTEILLALPDPVAFRALATPALLHAAAEPSVVVTATVTRALGTAPGGSVTWVPRHLDPDGTDHDHDHAERRLDPLTPADRR